MAGPALSFFKKDETGKPAEEAKNGNEALMLRLKKLFRLDADHAKNWRKESKEDFDFVAGEQWDAKDRAHLASLLRPIITFNRVLPIINSVSGQEISNRQEVRFVPREEGDAEPNEMLTEAGRWFRDLTSADDEDSDAFLNNTICGMGWTDTTLSYEEEEDGTPLIESINPLEMFWDCNARKKNLIDAERIWRVRQMSLARARDLFPGASTTDMDATWAQADISGNPDPTNVREALLYIDQSGGDDTGNDDDTFVTIVHVEWKTKVNVYTVADPTGQSSIELSEAEYAKLKKRAKDIGVPVFSTRRQKTQVKQAFLGSGVLQFSDGLCGDHFRYRCVTGYKDTNKGTFYGIVRAMKDPQRWANKWLSQTLDLMNTQVKGGVIIEKDAVEDMAEFERTWASASKPTLVNRGALTGPNGPKIKDKPVAQFPSSFFQLMEFAISATRDVTGISVEMLGLREADQPASLEFQRRQAGMTILAPLFQNLRRYRHDQGRVMLYLIQNYLSDGRLVRILGDNPRTAKYMPLMKSQDIKYDIIVDDMPTSPNQKEMVWALVGAKIWDLPPPIQMALLKYSPLPGKTVEEIQKAASSMSNSPQAQLQQQMQQLEAALTQATAELKNAQTQKTTVETQQIQQTIQAGGQGADPANMVKAQGDLQISAQESQQKTAIAQQEVATKAQTAQAKVQIEAQKAQGHLALQQNRQGFDQQIAAASFHADQHRAAQDQALQRQQATENMSLQRDTAQANIGIKRQQVAAQAKAAAAKPTPKLPKRG